MPKQRGAHVAPSRAAAPPASDCRRRLSRGPALTEVLLLGELALALACLAFGGDVWRALLLHRCLLVLCLAAEGLYRPRLHVSLLDDAPALFGRWLLVTATVGTAVALLDSHAEVLRFVLLVLAGSGLEVVFRGAVYGVVRYARRTGRVTRPTLVLGGGGTARRIAGVLEEEPAYGLRVVGYLDGAEGDAEVEPGPGGWTHLGPASRLEEVVRAFGVRAIVIAYGAGSDVDLVPLLRTARLRSLSVYVVPRLYEVARWRTGDHIGAIPVMAVRLPSSGGPGRVAKRVMDVCLASLALLVLAPLMAAVAIAVRIEGGPGILFRQIRIGRDGEPFELLKFRSIVATRAAGDTTWTVSHDRIGPVGRFLRRTSLDELPQLLNILRGDMTLVGPRPERPHFVDQFSADIPHYRFRHRVAAGLTGLAQVNGLRGNTSIEDRARFDNYYIDHWSLWMDIKVIARTISEVVFARGA